MVESYDIVIIGAGPVGLTLSLCLARWGCRIKHIDNRAEPTRTGRADGIQPRSLDLLKNLGLKRKLMAYGPAKVYEVAFWDPNPNGIHRTGTWPSCPKFIDARYPFSTLLHQGLIERVLIEDIERRSVTIERPWIISGFKNDGRDSTFPVEVSLAQIDGICSQTIRTKYLFSGEGARSSVRDQLGIKMHYRDPIAYVWGVIDGVVRTNFPDIKMKCTIHSDAGSIMLIPRENNMVRLYIQIASSADSDWNPRTTVTVDAIQRLAKEILQPYAISWDWVEWFSVYPIGQGIAEHYTIDHRIFLGGDACHTHSPKAGQGMNTAFFDAVNLAWKTHHVESGFAVRDILSTYESERRKVAQDLLEFDAKYAKLFSTITPSVDEIASSLSVETGGTDFVKAFKASCEFTSGYGVAYDLNMINWGSDHAAQHPLFLSYKKGTNLRTGRILPPATVTRVADANIVHLEQEIPVNGSYRMYIFAGRRSLTTLALHDLATHMACPMLFYTVFSHRDTNDERYHEQQNPHTDFLSVCTVFNSSHEQILISEDLPTVFARYRDHVYADDVQDERNADVEAGAHAKIGLSKARGGVVIVRPDGYVGCVVKLVEGKGTCEALNRYFSVLIGRTLGGVCAVL